MKSLLLTLCVLLLLLVGTGCIPWVISASMKAKAQEQAAYSQYLTDMERLNTEREKAGLTPRPILAVGEWRGTTKPTNSVPVRSPADTR